MRKLEIKKPELKGLGSPKLPDVPSLRQPEPVKKFTRALSQKKKFY